MIDRFCLVFSFWESCSPFCDLNQKLNNVRAANVDDFVCTDPQAGMTYVIIMCDNQSAVRRQPWDMFREVSLDQVLHG